MPPRRASQLLAQRLGIRLRALREQWKQTGFSDALRAAGMFDSDPLSRLITQHAIPELKDKFHDLDHKKIEDGQKAQVRIDAFPDRPLPGHVKSIATVAAQQDWMSADVKVYQTLVSVDESVDGLKPGMSAEVTIQIDGAAEEVLALPLQAIVGGAEMAGDVGAGGIAVDGIPVDGACVADGKPATPSLDDALGDARWIQQIAEAYGPR